MTEGDRTAVHVQLVHRNPEMLRRRNHLCRKSLVDLHEVDLIDGQSGA